MKELETLGIVDCYKDSEKYKSDKIPYLYFIREDFASVLGAPIPSPEFMSLSKSTLAVSEPYNEEEVEKEIDDDRKLDS